MLESTIKDNPEANHRYFLASESKTKFSSTGSLGGSHSDRKATGWQIRDLKMVVSDHRLPPYDRAKTDCMEIKTWHDAKPRPVSSSHYSGSLRYNCRRSSVISSHLAKLSLSIDTDSLTLGSRYTSPVV